MAFLNTGEIYWYSSLRTLIYKFHMNVFFFLTGILFFYTKDIDSTSFSYSNFLLSKLKKFGPPYFFFALIFFIGEFIFSPDKNLFLEKQYGYIIIVLFKPINSYSTFLWFLHVLFIFYATIPLALRLIKRNYRIIIIFFCYILTFLPFPNFLSLRLYIKYLPWFLIGMVYVDYRQIIISNIKKFGKYFFLILIIIFITDYYLYDFSKIILSFVAIIVILWISLINNKFAYIFEKIGKNAFPIYLQNMTIVGIIYLTLTRYYHFSVKDLQFFVPVFFIFSVLLPIFIKKIFQKKMKYLKAFLGYSI